MVPARFHKILVYILIFAITLALIPSTAGIGVGIFLVISFNAYVANRIKHLPKRASPAQQDIWNRNATRHQQRQAAQVKRPNRAQQHHLNAAFPWVMGFTFCTTMAVVIHFQLGFVAFIFLFIAITLATMQYVFRQVMKA